MRSKKFIYVITAFYLMFAFMGTGASAKSSMPEPLYNASKKVSVFGHLPDDIVTLIVEVDGDPLLADKSAKAMGVSYLQTNASEARQNIILKTHEDIMDSIERDASKRLKLEAVYTHLFNGFAIKAPYGDIEKIQNTHGVKSVCVSDDIKLDVHLSDSISMMGMDAEPASGYTGKGQLVAVIDTEFDTEHPFFSASPENPSIQTSAELEELIDGLDLSVDFLSSRLFKSQKIPFAYDYGGGTDGDYDTYSTKNVHGTHVAGIAGGKSNDGKRGAAPDAQLVLMKITDDNGNLNLTKAMQAMEDAAKLGVCAINCSFGADYISPSLDKAFEQCCANARGAGIVIGVSAGNMQRGFYKATPLTDNIDYSAVGIPSSFTAPVTVGAVTKTGKMASFSSYGVSDKLELKPDISAPGVSISSSLPNGSYEKKNGTSQASPHISGAAAVMNEYMDKNMPHISGDQRADIIENMLMSTAEAAVQDSGVPYSPRLQGAGSANVNNAVKTPVILNGSSGRCKLSLGDGLTDSIRVEFTAKNLTDTPVLYDDISCVVLTDGYTVSGGKSYVSASVKLNTVSSTLPESITIGGNETVQLSGEIMLDQAQTAENLEVFTNGFYIDGFISLKNTEDKVPDVGIPFTGFYGDWTKAAVFDSTIYDEGGCTLVNEKNYVYESFIYDGASGRVLGSNGAGGYDYKYIALSPDGDGQNDSVGFQFTPMRTMSHIESEITDKNGTVICSKKEYDRVFNKFITSQILLNDISDLEDGDYVIKLKGIYNYEKNNPTVHTLDIPMYVDTVVPEILSVSPNGSKVDVTFKDNRFISMVYTCYEDFDEELYYDVKNIENPVEGEPVTVSFDLEAINAQNAPYDKIYVLVHDDAQNVYINSLSCLLGDIHPALTDSVDSGGVYSRSLEIMNYKPETACTMLLAFYDATGQLICVNSKENITLPHGRSELEFSGMANLTGLAGTKLFIWDNTDGITPIDISKIIE